MKHFFSSEIGLYSVHFHISNTWSNKTDIQRETWTWRGTSREKLEHVLCFGSFESRRWYWKLCCLQYSITYIFIIQSYSYNQKYDNKLYISHLKMKHDYCKHLVLFWLWWNGISWIRTLLIQKVSSLSMETFQPFNAWW